MIILKIIGIVAIVIAVLFILSLFIYFFNLDMKFAPPAHRLCRRGQRLHVHHRPPAGLSGRAARSEHPPAGGRPDLCRTGLQLFLRRGGRPAAAGPAGAPHGPVLHLRRVGPGHHRGRPGAGPPGAGGLVGGGV